METGWGKKKARIHFMVDISASVLCNDFHLSAISYWLQLPTPSHTWTKLYLQASLSFSFGSSQLTAPWLPLCWCHSHKAVVTTRKMESINLNLYFNFLQWGLKRSKDDWFKKDIMSGSYYLSTGFRRLEFRIQLHSKQPWYLLIKGKLHTVFSSALFSRCFRLLLPQAKDRNLL